MTECVTASAAETQMWRRIRHDPADRGTVITYAFVIPPEVSQATIRQRIAFMLNDGNPNFRSRFFACGDQLYKTLSPPQDDYLEVVETERITARQQARWTTLRPDDGVLYRFLWVTLPDRCVLYTVFSHLILDGSGYRDLCLFLGDALPPAWRARRADGQPVALPYPAVGEDDRRFWRAALAGKPLSVRLPFLLPPRSGQQSRTLRDLQRVDADLYGRMQAFCRTEALSLFQLLLAVTGLTLSRYQPDAPGVMLAYPVNLRGEHAAVGCYFNTIPCWIDATPEQTVRDWLAAIRAQRRAARAHQHTPLREMLSEQTLSETAQPLNVVVNYSEGMLPLSGPRLNGVSCQPCVTPDADGPFDLVVSVNADETQLLLALDMPQARADYAILRDFRRSWLQICAWLLENAEQKLGAASLARPRQPALRGLPLPIADDASLIRTILRHSRTQPHKVAVRYEAATLGYQALIELAARIASQLAAQQSAPDGAAVGLCLRRTLALPALLLACLAQRLPFMPLLPEQPEAALRETVQRAGMTRLICDDAAHERLCAALPDVQVIALSALCQPADAPPAPLPAPPALHDTPAYWIATSGTTGQPKIIEVSQRNLYNFLLSMRQHPGLCAQDELLALTPLIFDIALLELLLPLFCGATVTLVPDRIRTQAALLGEAINRSTATVVQATPSTWQMLQNDGWVSQRPLRILCGGEALSRPLADYLLEQGATLYNVYGPTETTVWASAGQITDAALIALGRPVYNTEFYVLDDQFRSLPMGVAGQLVIRGAAVARGYRQRASDAFRLLDGQPAYCTGDRVCLRGEAGLFYLGRQDDQLKVRGHRVEPAEIDRLLQTLAPSALFCTVAGRQPEPHLKSYFVRTYDAPLDVADLLAALRQTLPAYKVPQSLTELRAFPLTANGKRDVKALAAGAIDGLRVSPSAARAATRPADAASPQDITARLQAEMLRALGVRIDDPALPLGWYGINSLSYNVLSRLIADRFQVSLLPHQLMGETTLNDIAAKIQPRQPRATPQPAAPVAGTEEDIAVIGFAAQLPGDADAERFWQGLLTGKNWVGAPQRPWLSTPRPGAYLERIDGFDPLFFHITPVEAHQMDPRQRLLLQIGWQAVEHAGYSRRSLAGTATGCYIAASGMDYLLLQARDFHSRSHTLAGTALAVLPHRLSWFFDWKGPSVVHDSACSGSLTALIQAMRDLRAGRCRQALVGAANLILSDLISDALAAGGYLSPRAHCAAFDAQGDGYVRGEGVIGLLLKRLSDAERDRDSVYAVIKAGHETHGGKSASLSTPKAEEQARLLIETYSAPLIRQVSYVETHGTGTRLGDPIEAEGLRLAWRHYCGDQAPQPVQLGALKRNIGHLEAAAGLASVLKVIQAIRYRTLPGCRPISQQNPLVDFSGTPFRLTEQTQRWQSDGPLTAGVSAFNFGGNNAHVVLSEPPALVHDEPAAVGEALLFTLSAHSARALERQRVQWLAYLQTCPDDRAHFCNMAFTLNNGREHFRHRLGWIARDRTELRSLMADDAALACPDAPPDLLARLQAWLAGETEAVTQLYADRRWRRIALPGSAFDLRPFWFDRAG